MKGFKLGLLLIALVLLPSKAEAVRQWIPYSSGISMSTIADSYFDMMASNSIEVASGSENQVEGILKDSGTFSSLSVNSTTAPGAGNSWIWTLVINGSDTGVACTIADSATTCNSGANTATYASGDRLYWRVSPVSGPAGNQFNASIINTTDTSKYVTFWGGGPSLTGNLTRYTHMIGDRSAYCTTVNTSCRIAVPMAGTLRRFVLRSSADPGITQTYTATVRLNNADTGLTCQITSGNTTCSDDTNTVAVTVGDVIELKIVSSITAATATMQFGWIFETNDNTKHPLFLNTPNLSDTAVRYTPVQAAGNLGIVDNIEADVQQIGQSNITLSNFYALLSAAPGTGGDAYTGTVRIAGVDTVQTITITDAETSGLDLGAGVAITTDDLVSISWTPAVTPAVVQAFASFVVTTATALTGDNFAMFFD